MSFKQLTQTIININNNCNAIYDNNTKLVGKIAKLNKNIKNDI